MRRLVTSLILIVGVLGTGTGAAYWLYTLRSEPPRRDRVPLPPLVDTVVPRAEDVVERYVGYGTAAADRTAALSAEVAATVTERVGDIEAGSKVHDGQVLLRLADDEYRYAVVQAEALAAADAAEIDVLNAERAGLETLMQTARRELRVAADERARLSDLFERDQAHKKEYDFATLAYEQALRVLQAYEKDLAAIAPRIERARASQRSRDAEAARARLQVRRCTIVAPFAGTIHDIAVDAGDRVAPGTHLLTIVDASSVEVPIRLPLSVRSGVVIGARCRLATEHDDSAVWHGRVARIAPIADVDTRTFAVYIDVPMTVPRRPPNAVSDALSNPAPVERPQEDSGVVSKAMPGDAPHTIPGEAKQNPTHISLPPGDPGVASDGGGRVARHVAHVGSVDSPSPGTIADTAPLMPGTFVRALVDGPAYAAALLVPRGAVRNGYVMVVENGLARRRRVTVEGVILDRMRVTGEVRSGDRVIISHLDRLLDGSPVRVHADHAPSAGALTNARPAAEATPR